MLSFGTATGETCHGSGRSGFQNVSADLSYAIKSKPSLFYNFCLLSSFVLWMTFLYILLSKKFKDFGIILPFKCWGLVWSGDQTKRQEGLVIYLLYFIHNFSQKLILVCFVFREMQGPEYCCNIRHFINCRTLFMKLFDNTPFCWVHSYRFLLAMVIIWYKYQILLLKEKQLYLNLGKNEGNKIFPKQRW